MRLFVAICLLMFSFPALAQQQQQPLTSFDQALSAKLSEEINANIALRSQLIQTQEQLRKLIEADRNKPVEPEKKK